MIVLTLAATSCFTDKKLAKSFVNEGPGIRIVLTPASALYKFNHKGEAIENFDSLTVEQQDSALYWSSLFIREISDSLFLESYVNNFLTELRKLGFTVYITDLIDTSAYEYPQTYVVNMTQLQLDEYFYPYEDEVEYDDYRYVKSFDLNAIDFSVWYELSKLKTGTPSTTILYTTHSMTDGMDGRFMLDPFANEVIYRYDIDSVTMSDVMTMAANLGRRHAGYLYDFFLNQYVSFHMPEGETPFYYYHYNRFHNRFEPVDSERFQWLE